MTGYRIRFTLKGASVQTYGVDMGRGLTQIHQCGDAAIWKQPGQTVWSGVGRTAYYETHYYLVTTRDDDDGRRRIATVVEEIAPGKFWKKAVAALRAKCDQQGVVAP